MSQHIDLDQLYAQSSGGDSVETRVADLDLREAWALLRVDCEFFIDLFLGESLDMEVPGFHKEIWSLMTDEEKERVLLAIPRDHAKTTLAKLVVLWYWFFTSHRFCVYLSNTNSIAKGACKDIVEFLKHPNLRAVGVRILKAVKESENESLWIYDLRLPTGKEKRVILRAIGQGQQMRGINIDNQRPDIAVIDDVEDNENTESETQQKKLDRWMFGPFLKALARRKRILWLGNMLQKTSLLARLSRNQRWNPVVFGSLVHDTATGQLVPLWPEKWLTEDQRALPKDEQNRIGVEVLKADLKEYKDMGLVESWMCEMMNMPGHGENGFSLDQINYQAVYQPDQIRAAWITIDPAFGMNAENDETCIAVHAIPIHGIPMTVAETHGKFDEFTMLSNALKLAHYWNAWVWGIEAVAAQRVLISLFNVLLAQRQMLGRVEMLPLMAGRGDPKASRIRAFVSLMANGEWAIPDSDVDITTQITEYDFRKKEQKDDIVDSCAYGPMMMELYLAIIMAQAAGLLGDGVDSEPVVGSEVASV